MTFEEAVGTLAGTGRPAALERVVAEVETQRVRAEAAEAKVEELLAAATDVPSDDPATGG